jgi:thiol-disulfide isomerase/thioredoxin
MERYALAGRWIPCYPQEQPPFSVFSMKAIVSSPLLFLAAGVFAIGLASAPLHAADPAPPPAAVDAEVAALKTADDLFNYIQEWSDKTPDISEGLDRDALREKIMVFLRDKAAHLNPACTEFVKQYPQDPRRWETQLIRLEAQAIHLDAGKPEELAAAKTQYQDVLKQIVAAPDAKQETKQMARQRLISMQIEENKSAGLTDALEAQLSAYEKDFPDDPSGGETVRLRMQLLGDAPAEKITQMLAALSKSPNAAAAKVAQGLLALRSGPPEIKFTAVDGREVDLAKLRGKPVLIDFWATWCGPCVQEVPNVVAVYKKYHDRGFEIVGISLDEDKEALEKFVKEKEMPWPQYFDGKGWENEFSKKFGIDSIPRMWLIGPDGKIVDFTARTDLDAKVAKLLDQPAAPGASATPPQP